MILNKKNNSQRPELPNAASLPCPAAESFEVDLRKALADTDVQELSFEEFHRTLVAQGRLKHQ